MISRSREKTKALEEPTENTGTRSREWQRNRLMARTGAKVVPVGVNEGHDYVKSHKGVISKASDAN